jgi:hypothetical protein
MNETEKLAFKSRLKTLCYSIIKQRITAVKSAIEEAQQAANFEEKSSAGDKYETSRAMGHLEKDMHSRQLAAHLKELAELDLVNTGKVYAVPAAGAFVRCSRVSFFIASGSGRQVLDGDSIVFLSPYAPLAKTLYLKKKGDRFVFNGVEEVIEEVF